MDKTREWYILYMELLILLRKEVKFMTLEVIGNEYKAVLSHEDLKKIVSCVHFYGDFNQYTFVGKIDKGRVQESTNNTELISDQVQESEKRYTRLFDALKFNWMINCEHDYKLTDKIERCEAALTTLKNLGFNLVNGEVE